MTPATVPFVRRISGATLLSVVLISPACERAPVIGPDAVPAAGVSGGGANQAPDTPATLNAQLAELRALTARFHDLDEAMAAGYTVLVTPCLALPGTGAMGFHYGNPAYINDPAVNYLQPELLLYEPQKNGKLRFVGVEYIIPFALLPSTATPPTLLGQTMHTDFAGNLWALHAWVGRHNPAGMFADWNPKVSCEFAS